MHTEGNTVGKQMQGVLCVFVRNKMNDNSGIFLWIPNWNFTLKMIQMNKKNRIYTNTTHNSGNEDNVWNRTQENCNRIQHKMCEFKRIWHEICSITLQSNEHFCFYWWAHLHAELTNMIILHAFLCFQNFRPSILFTARLKIPVKMIISTFNFACDDLFLIWPDHCKLHAKKILSRPEKSVNTKKCIHLLFRYITLCFQWIVCCRISKCKLSYSQILLNKTNYQFEIDNFISILFGIRFVITATPFEFCVPFVACYFLEKEKHQPIKHPANKQTNK